MLALLLTQIVPAEWAVLEAIVGGLIGVILFLSARQLRWGPEGGVPWELRWPRLATLGSFRLLAVAFAGVTFLAAHRSVHLPIHSSLFSDAVLWLSLTGLLGLALHEEPFHAGLALLVFLGGNQLLLLSLYQRRSLIGLTLGSQLLLGLAISYLVLSRGLDVPRGSRTPDEPAEGPAPRQSSDADPRAEGNR